MSALPEGTVRPPIDAPRLRAHDVCNPTADQFTKRWLTSYRFRDTSQWTMRDFDHRLRWTLYATHLSMTGDGDGTRGHVRVTVDVWSRSDAEWHEVWDVGRAAASPYGTDTKTKMSEWNAILSELAQYVTEVLT
jgi:hypothetical protein